MEYVPPSEYNVVVQQQVNDDFQLEANTAQYKGSDYSNVVRVARRISLEQAFEIARNDVNVDYFVYVKGGQMVLELPSDVKYDPASDPFGLVIHHPFRFDDGSRGNGYIRVFNHGDVVFFKKDGLWLGSAPGLADTYFKK